ncbi:MAG TPA: hypothetical protein DIW31_00935, partial [Bacteroidales bacterium]|nr:hypothetical protein [Bacteroidales bacterium]
MAKESSPDKGFYFWIENLSDRIFNYIDIHLVGIMGTISIHLILAIVLLFVKMNYTPTPRSVEIDINFRDELLPITEEQRQQMDQVDMAIEKLIHQGLEADVVKNVAVDAASNESNELNPTLKDDKGINASDLYREAGEVKQRMSDNKENYEKTQMLSGQEEIPNTPVKNTALKEEGKYKGPAVISYYLE